MTPYEIQIRCAGIQSPGKIPLPSNPQGLRAALEVACDENPTSLPLRRLLLDAHALTILHDQRPERVDGIRLEQLVRWDDHTSTWNGTEMSTGQHYQVRLLDPRRQNEPILKRMIARDYHLLSPLFPSARLVDEPQVAILLPLPGEPYTETEGHLEDLLAIRLIGAGLCALETWAEHDLVPPPLSPLELRDEGASLRIACLSPLQNDRLSIAMRDLLSLLKPSYSSAHLASFLNAIASFEHEDLTTVRSAWAHLLAENLTSHRHQLTTRWKKTTLHSHSERLYDAIIRLQDACPAPEGRGVVGVDLEGKVLLVESRGGEVKWGSNQELVTVIAPDSPLDPTEARRVLRARASATLNRHLHERHGADILFTESICAWLSSSMRLRALRLLLETLAR